MTELVQNPRILVTGGTGFIGVPLCAQLKKLGYSLTVLTRHPKSARKKLGDEVELVTGLDQLGDRQFGALINLAGESLASGRWSDKRKEEFRRSRIGTTEALFDYFRALGEFPEVLISGSAVGYYGDQGDRPLTEESPQKDDSFSEQLCRDWEAVAERFSDFGTRVCLLRTGIVLGRDGGALQSMLLPFKLGLGGRLGKGRQRMSWIHRQDIVGLIVFCLCQKAIHGPVNGTAPNPVTNRVFTRTLARTLRRPAFLPVPAPVLRLLMGDMADELLLAGQRVLPEVALVHGYNFQYPELGCALENILRSKKARPEPQGVKK